MITFMNYYGNGPKPEARVAESDIRTLGFFYRKGDKLMPHRFRKGEPAGGVIGERQPLVDISPEHDEIFVDDWFVDGYSTNGMGRMEYDVESGWYCRRYDPLSSSCCQKSDIGGDIGKVELFECVIPKGARYYVEDEDDPFTEYVSETVIPVRSYVNDVEYVVRFKGDEIGKVHEMIDKVAEAVKNDKRVVDMNRLFYIQFDEETFF